MPHGGIRTHTVSALNAVPLAILGYGGVMAWQPGVPGPAGCADSHRSIKSLWPGRTGGLPLTKRALCTELQRQVPRLQRAARADPPLLTVSVEEILTGRALALSATDRRPRAMLP